MIGDETALIYFSPGGQGNALVLSIPLHVFCHGVAGKNKTEDPVAFSHGLEHADLLVYPSRLNGVRRA